MAAVLGRMSAHCLSFGWSTIQLSVHFQVIFTDYQLYFNPSFNVGSCQCQQEERVATPARLAAARCPVQNALCEKFSASPPHLDFTLAKFSTDYSV
jgi:hypothetical protein